MIFCSFVAEKFGVVVGRYFYCLMGVFEGVLEKLVCRRGAFCGEVVVGCVANVDKKTILCSV